MEYGWIILLIILIAWIGSVIWYFINRKRRHLPLIDEGCGINTKRILKLYRKQKELEKKQIKSGN